MPPVTDITRCTGCGSRPESFCEEICPGDLMAVSNETGRSFCRNPRDCWDCMSCIKVCPAGALETKMPYQLGYHKATLRPVMGKDEITWVCRDIHGNEHIYTYKNRLTGKN